MAEKPKASPIRIIQSDAIAVLGIIWPLVGFLMYAVAALGILPNLRAGTSIFLYVGIAGALIGLPIAFWRIRTIMDRFSKGVEVVGQITGIGFYRDRGRVEYAYTHLGQTYSGGHGIMKTGRTEMLRVGGQVVLLVDPNNPRSALIRDLYV